MDYSKHPLKIFFSYYKPHLPLFVADMVCAGGFVKGKSIKKSAFFIAAFFFSCALAFSKSPYDSYYDSLPALSVDLERVEEWTIPEKRVSVLDYKNLCEKTYFKDWDGKEYSLIWTRAIKAAISELSDSGGGHLVFPKGTYLSGPVILQDNVELYLEEGSLLLASPDKNLYYNKKDKTDFIYAKNARNIAVSGKGTIDGNGEFWWPIAKSKIESALGKAEAEKYWKDCLSRGGLLQESNKGETWWPYEKSWDKIGAACIGSDFMEQEHKRGVYIIGFVDCENVKISGVKLRNSPKMHCYPTRCRNLIVDGLSIYSPVFTPNTDGLDICMCSKAIIVNCSLTCGDDGIIFKSATAKTKIKKKISDVLVCDNVTDDTHCGFGLGSENVAGTERVIVCRNRFKTVISSGGIAFKTPAGRGGETKDIYIFDNEIINARWAIAFNTFYESTSIGGSVTDKDDKTKFFPDLKGIHIWNIRAEAGPLSKNAVYMDGISEERPVHDIHIEGSTFRGFENAVNLRSASDIHIKNCDFDTGRVFISDTCHKIDLEGSKAGGKELSFEENNAVYKKKILWKFGEKPDNAISEDSKSYSSLKNLVLKEEKGLVRLSATGKVQWSKKSLRTSRNKVDSSSYKKASAYFELELREKSDLSFTVKSTSSNDNAWRFAFLTSVETDSVIASIFQLEASPVDIQGKNLEKGKYRLYLNGGALTEISVKSYK